MTPDSAFDTEHNNLAFNAMLFQYGATITGSPATVAEDAAFRMLGDPELSQAEQTIMRLQGRTMRHLAAHFSGGYSKTIAGTSGGIFAEALIDFNAIMPGAYVSGEVKSFVRGNVEPLASYSSTAPTGLAGKLRNAVRTIEAPVGAQHLRPAYREFGIGIDTAAADKQHLITVDQDTVMAGLFFLMRDASTGHGGQRSDAIARRIKIEVTRGNEGTRTLYDLTWGQARSLSARFAGFTDLDWDQATGTVFLPFLDEKSRWNGRMAFQEGDTILVTVDSQATIEEHLGSAVTPASGDELRVVRLDHHIIGGAVSAPDTVAPVARRNALRTPPARRNRGGRRRARRNR